MIPAPLRRHFSHAVASGALHLSLRLSLRLTLSAVCGVTLGASSLLSAATITLVDEQLNLKPVRLQSVDEKAITFFDANGNFQTRQVNDFLQLRLALSADELEQAKAKAKSEDKDKQTSKVAPAAANVVTNAAEAVVPAGENNAAGADAVNVQEVERSAWGFVELIDGQRFIGRFIGSDEAGQVMQWAHPQAGRLSFKLDLVRQWRFGVESTEAAKGVERRDDVAAQGADRLVLANGDTLLGFVSSVTQGGVTFKPQGSDQAVLIERVRVTTITLANVPVSQDQPGAMVTLADGSRLRVSRLVIERGRMSFEPALQSGAEPISLDLAQLRQLDFANPRWQLLPWQALSRETMSDEKVFTTPWPVREQAGDLYLHAPAVVALTLPAGSRVVAAELELDVEPSDPGRAWSDFAVLLTLSDGAAGGDDKQDPAELARETINEQKPAGRLRAALTQSPTSTGPRTLTLTLDPALNGPIMDRLKVSDAWVVVERR